MCLDGAIGVCTCYIDDKDTDKLHTTRKKDFLQVFAFALCSLQDTAFC
jgi:hypothetical protein